MTLQPTIGHLSPRSPRAADWLRIFGTLDIPLCSPVAVLGNDPDGHPAHFFQVDWRKLDEATLGRVLVHLAEKFNLSHREVMATLEDPNHGFPILADDVGVTFDARPFL